MNTFYLNKYFEFWLMDLLFSITIIAIIVYVAYIFRDWKKEYVNEEQDTIRDVPPCDCGCYSEEEEK